MLHRNQLSSLTSLSSPLLPSLLSSRVPTPYPQPHTNNKGLLARFDFTPLHPYALHVRSGMSFPVAFHNAHSLQVRPYPGLI